MMVSKGKPMVNLGIEYDILKILSRIYHELSFLRNLNPGRES